MRPIRESTPTVIDGEVVRYKFGDGAFHPEISASRNMVAFSGGSMSIDSREKLYSVVETLIRAYVQHEHLHPNQGSLGRRESLNERETSRRGAQLLHSIKKQVDQRLLNTPCQRACCWHQEGEGESGPMGRSAVYVCCHCGSRGISTKQEPWVSENHGPHAPKAPA